MVGGGHELETPSQVVAALSNPPAQLGALQVTLPAGSAEQDPAPPTPETQLSQTPLQVEALQQTQDPCPVQLVPEAVLTQLLLVQSLIHPSYQLTPQQRDQSSWYSVQYSVQLRTLSAGHPVSV